MWLHDSEKSPPVASAEAEVFLFWPYFLIFPSDRFLGANIFSPYCLHINDLSISHKQISINGS